MSTNSCAVYEMARSMGVELSTSTLHNAWQFYKNDNYFYDRKPCPQGGGLITSQLSSSKPKNWFRAYLNLGLIEKSWPPAADHLPRPN